MTSFDPNIPQLNNPLTNNQIYDSQEISNQPMDSQEISNQNLMNAQQDFNQTGKQGMSQGISSTNNYAMTNQAIASQGIGYQQLNNQSNTSNAFSKGFNPNNLDTIPRGTNTNSAQGFSGQNYSNQNYSGQGYNNIHYVTDLMDDDVQRTESYNVQRDGNKTTHHIHITDKKTSNKYMKIQQIVKSLLGATSKIKEPKDKDTKLLMDVLHTGLQYLNGKQNELKRQTSKTMINYKQLIHQSYVLEESLYKNKIILKENKKEKKNKENFLIIYKALVDENARDENVAKILLEDDRKKKERAKGRYFCHICEGKWFKSEDALEFHMKKRHMNCKVLNQIKGNSLNESYEFYGKRIEEMKTHFECLIKDRETEKMKNQFYMEMEKDRKENQEKLDYMETRLKDMLQDFKSFVIQSMKVNFDEHKRQQSQPNKVGERDNNTDYKMVNNNLELITENLKQLNNLITSQCLSKPKEVVIQKEIYSEKINTSTTNERNKEIQNQKTEVNNETSNMINNNNQTTSKVEESKTLLKDKMETNNIDNDDNNYTTKKINPNDEESDNKGNSSDNNEEEIQKESQRKETNYPLNQTKNIYESYQDSPFDNLQTKKLPKGPELKKEPKKEKKPLVELFPIKPEEVDVNKYKSLKSTQKLEEFYHKFLDRDNELLDERRRTTTDDYLHTLLPDFELRNIGEAKRNKLKDDKFNEDLSEYNNTFRKDLGFEESFKNSKKYDLLQEIEKTIKNIDNANAKNEMTKTYFNGIHNTLDLKIIEEEKENLNGLYGLGGKSKVSKHAQRAIDEASNFTGEI